MERKKDPESDNLFAFPIRNEQEFLVIKCQKCGTITSEKNCPSCGIPVLGRKGCLKNGKVIKIEDFRKKPAIVYPFPVPKLIKQIWICACGRENDGDECWDCGENKPIG